jgi:adenylate cyclase
MKVGWDLVAGAAILIGALAVRAVDPLPLQQLRNLTFDSYQRLKPRAYDPAIPVVIAAIDEKSLDTFGQWPWSRATLARITDRLTELGAAALAFDVIFAEPDRTSPAAVAASLPPDPQYEPVRAQLASLPDPDAQFAEALARAPSVLAFAYTADPAVAADPSIEFPYGFSIVGTADEAYVAEKVQGGPYAILPLPILMRSAHGLGEVHAGEPDPDGIARRVPLAVAIGDRLYPTLAGDALRVGIGGQTAQVRLTKDGFIDRMRIGEAIIPVNDRGELLLYDTGAMADRYVSLGEIFDPGFDGGRIAAHIVLIGSTVEGLKDIRSTPLAPVMPGVEIHAQILEQILGNVHLTRPYNADAIETYFLGGFGLALLAVLVYRRSAILGAVVLVSAVAVALGTSWWQFADKGNLFDPIYPALAAFAMYGSTTLINYLRTEGEKRYVRTAFAQYLSPVLVDRLSRHPELLKLGGELRELTLMFCDIRGFTRISESLDPQELTRLMNSFLTPMTRLIQDREGSIDKYIGDCIMAFWNAPLDVPRHAEKAILAALDMRAGLRQLNAAMAAAAGGSKPAVELRIGIGLNSGTGCVGNMGSEQRFNYTVLGDAVNIASRLEALSPAYGVDLVIGEETAEGAPELAMLELDLVRVRGKLRPIRIFTCVGDQTVAATSQFQTLQAAQTRLLAHCRAKQWDQAEAALAECRALAPEFIAGLYDVYARRIADYRIAPPPADWDGVYEAKSKAG